jgi:hypothetical protein
MRRTLLCLLALPVSLALGGCLNPRDALDEFGKRYEELPDGEGGAGGSGGGAACALPAVGEADGTYLFSLVAPDLGGKKAFALTAEVTSKASDAGLVLDMTLQGLSRLDETSPVGDPNAAMPVGDPIVLTNLAVAADGSFSWDLGTITLVGAANPISGGDVETTLVLAGELCGAERLGFVCGSATGLVAKPIPDFELEGGFTMQLIDGDLPAPAINCAKDPAEY